MLKALFQVSRGRALESTHTAHDKAVTTGKKSAFARKSGLFGVPLTLCWLTLQLTFLPTFSGVPRRNSSVLIG
ncbi:MAG: hypothetical protein WB382_05310, partial [Pseudolabrys sp.]